MGYDRKAWLFESSLLSLKPFNGCTLATIMDVFREFFWLQMHDLPIACMNEEMGTFIGNTIGTVKECDVQNDGSGWDAVLRVLIELDIHKRITRGQTLNVKGIKTWAPLTYEKLLKNCFRCGRIIHGQGLCDGEKASYNSSSGHFGPWLRVKSGNRAGRMRTNFQTHSSNHPESSDRDSEEKKVVAQSGNAEMEGGLERGRKTNQNCSSQEPISHQILVEPFLETGGSTLGQLPQVANKVQRVSEDEQTKLGSPTSRARPMIIPKESLEKGGGASPIIHMSSPMESLRHIKRF